MSEPVEDPYAEDPDATLAEIDYFLPYAVEELRDIARQESALAARKLTAVVRVTGILGAAAAAELAKGPRVSGQPDADRVAETAVVTGLATVLGISEFQAGRLSTLAERLERALPDTFAALAAGRLDLDRARALAEATLDCPLDEAREVEKALLDRAGDSPWDGPSPRAWRARINRAVATNAPAVAEQRRARALADRAVRSWAGSDGDGTMRWTASLEEIAMAEAVVAALADRWGSDDEHGRKLTADQRRSEALADIFRRVRDGQQLPDLGQRRSDVDRVTLVLHADTFLRDGPAAGAPGQLRGLGQPAFLDYFTARRLAVAAVNAGAAFSVFLTDTAGRLTQVVNLRTRPSEGWTREQLVAAVKEALQADPPALQTESYRPTAAIVRHVHARNPHCTSYNCPRTAARCDLDHDTPWPRGPTHADNLQPRCPRHHEHKTRRLVTTRLHPDGTVDHDLLTGLRVTTKPEPLPGHGPAEGYDS
jgi:Domain of unknown function (DUF222)